MTWRPFPYSDSPRNQLHPILIQSCVRTFCEVLRTALKMFCCLDQKCTMAQYFRQPFPKPWRYGLHYSVHGAVATDRKEEHNSSRRWRSFYLCQLIPIPEATALSHARLPPHDGRCGPLGIIWCNNNSY